MYLVEVETNISLSKIQINRNKIKLIISAFTIWSYW